MKNNISEMALFRLSVLGELASREHLERGELKKIIKELANKSYKIPNSKHTKLSQQSIKRWYYLWLKNGIEGLIQCPRTDKNSTKLSTEVQRELINIKKDNQARSLNSVIAILETKNIISKNSMSRATVHRFLQRNNLSKRTLADSNTIERRSFTAVNAGDIWQGDVLHGPRIMTENGMRKTYLVSFLDDASRLITHSEFCLSEAALDVEGVLKTAILKRGLPKKIIIDNGAAYRAESLQDICARLQIRLIYCPAYEPQGKGKLERFHRTFRALFLNEINLNTNNINGLADLNARLRVWLEQVYHQRPHTGLLNNATPIERFRSDLHLIRQLGLLIHSIDDIFYHRIKRTVKKDGTVSIDGNFFEVPYELSGSKIILVFDPHKNIPIRVESIDGKDLGAAIKVDKLSNIHRKRQRPNINLAQSQVPQKYYAVDNTYQDYCKSLDITNFNNEDK